MLKEAANTVCEFTKNEVDSPSENHDGWMPILDNKVRIENKKVDWSFYKKTVDSELFILNRSALSNKIKKASLAQEGLRRLRNTRPDKVNERKGRLLTDMAEAMMKSGYPENYRKEVLQLSVIGYERQIAAYEAGVTPLYRPRSWNKEERKNKRRLKVGWAVRMRSEMEVPLNSPFGF